MTLLSSLVQFQKRLGEKKSWYSIKIFGTLFPRSPWSNTEHPAESIIQKQRYGFDISAHHLWLEIGVLVFQSCFWTVLDQSFQWEKQLGLTSWAAEPCCFTSVIFFTLSCGEIGTQFRIFSFSKGHQLSPTFYTYLWWKW